MLAINETAALHNLMDCGLSLEAARQRLAAIKPAARYNGAAYYSPRALARLTKGN